MSKIFITTIDSLSQIFPFSCDKDVSEMIVFHKEKDTIPAQLASSMFLACNQGLTIQMFVYAAKDELMFRLGMLLQKDVEYIISDGVFVIPDWLKSEYKITVDGVKNKTSRRTTGKRSSKKTETQPVISVTDANQNTEEVPVEPFELNLQSVQESVHDDGVELGIDVASDVQSVSKGTKSRKKIAPSVPDVVDCNAGIVTTDGVCDKNAVVADISVSDGYDFTEDVIRTFLQRSGLRVSDMDVYAGTDLDLGNVVLGILKQDTDKDRIAIELERTFTESEIKTIMSWIGPNLKNLHKLAQ